MYTIAIPSRGRHDTIQTIKLFPSATIFVPKSEEYLYRQNNPNSHIVVADIENETAPKKRNFILNYYTTGTKLLMLDDDIKGFGKKQAQKIISISLDELSFWIEQAFLDIERQDINLWGMYICENAFFMKERIARHALVVGKVMGIIVNHLRFDEAIFAKEDFAYSVQNILNYKGVYRFDFLTPLTAKDDAKGGCSTYRNDVIRQQDCVRILEKFPSHLKPHANKKNEITMTPVQYLESPRWSAEIYDCSMPMTFDTYSNCAFSCLYCFAQFQKSLCRTQSIEKQTQYLNKEARYVNVDRIKKLFRGEFQSQFNTFIAQRKVLQWGGMSDPFCYFEKKYGVTLELLRFFRDIEYPICFSTKGTWWLDDSRYTDLFKGADFWNCKFSIITGDEYKAKRVEKGVAAPSERIKAIEKYSKLNKGGATLRLRPFIVGISDPSYTQLMKDAASAGATAVSTEFFCMELRTPSAREKYHEMSQLAGFDLVAFYRRYSYGSGYLRLNRNVKRPFFNEMENICKETGMRFYVSDAHFKERCHNGSCCGLPPDWNYSKGQFCEALVIARDTGQVKWSDIAPFMEYAKTFEWGKAEGYNQCSQEKRAKFWGMTMFDFLHDTWNNPNSGQSPYVMYDGVLRPTVKDEHGDYVYVFDSSRA